jgi:putative transposase
MLRKRKHSQAEIVAKLAQAEGFAKEGRLQVDIARALGVSVMTLHRWRKSKSEPPIQSPSMALDEASQFEQELGPDERIADLQSENSRLRRLVTDLLLEKMKLEEASQGQRDQLPRRSRGAF